MYWLYAMYFDNLPLRNMELQGRYRAGLDDRTATTTSGRRFDVYDKLFDVTSLAEFRMGRTGGATAGPAGEDDEEEEEEEQEEQARQSATAATGGPGSASASGSAASATTKPSSGSAASGTERFESGTDSAMTSAMSAEARVAMTEATEAFDARVAEEAEAHRENIARRAEEAVNTPTELHGVIFSTDDMDEELKDKLKEVLRSMDRTEAEMLVNPEEKARALSITPPEEKGWLSKTWAITKATIKPVAGLGTIALIGLHGSAATAVSSAAASLGTWLGATTLGSAVTTVTAGLATGVLGGLLTGTVLAAAAYVGIKGLLRFFNGSLVDEINGTDRKPMCKSVFERAIAQLDAHRQQLRLMGVFYEQVEGQAVGVFRRYDDTGLAELKTKWDVTVTAEEAEKNAQLLQELLDSKKVVFPIYKRVTVIEDTPECLKLIAEEEAKQNGGKTADATTGGRVSLRRRRRRHLREPLFAHASDAELDRLLDAEGSIADSSHRPAPTGGRLGGARHGRRFLHGPSSSRRPHA
jgi:hypothetical protein